MSSSAAAVTMRPVFCRPTATACSLSRSRSYSSLMRDEQEDLVVHREPERDAEHEDRREDVDGARRREAEQVGEVALLEDPDHRAERRGEAEHVEQQRLDRHEQAAGHQEQQHERRERDEPERHGRRSEDRLPWCRRARADGPATVNANGAGRRRGCRCDELLALLRDRLDVGHDRELRAGGARRRLKNRVVSRQRRDRGHVGAVLEGRSRWRRRRARRPGARASFLAKASMAAASVVGIDVRERSTRSASALAAREVLADLVGRGPAARHVGRHDPVVDQARG